MSIAYGDGKPCSRRDAAEAGRTAAAPWVSHGPQQWPEYVSRRGFGRTRPPPGPHVAMMKRRRRDASQKLRSANHRQHARHNQQRQGDKRNQRIAQGVYSHGSFSEWPGTGTWLRGGETGRLYVDDLRQVGDREVNSRHWLQLTLTFQQKGLHGVANVVRHGDARPVAGVNQRGMGDSDAPPGLEQG